MFLQGRTTKHTIGGADDDLLRNQTISMDFTCQAYVLLAIKHYAEALALDVKHVYQALPRLLSLWFDLTSSNSIMEGNLAFDQISKDGEIKGKLLFFSVLICGIRCCLASPNYFFKKCSKRIS
jgi:hypothetical protein